MKQAVRAVGEDKFSFTDLERFAQDSAYVTRFWFHVQKDEGDRKENTIRLAIIIFMWRKGFGVENLKEKCYKVALFISCM